MKSTLPFFHRKSSVYCIKVHSPEVCSATRRKWRTVWNCIPLDELGNTYRPFYPQSFSNISRLKIAKANKRSIRLVPSIDFNIYFLSHMIQKEYICIIFPGTSKRFLNKRSFNLSESCWNCKCSFNAKITKV